MSFEFLWPALVPFVSFLQSSSSCPFIHSHIYSFTLCVPASLFFSSLLPLDLNMKKEDQSSLHYKRKKRRRGRDASKCRAEGEEDREYNLNRRRNGRKIQVLLLLVFTCCWFSLDCFFRPLQLFPPLPWKVSQEVLSFLFPSQLEDNRRERWRRKVSQDPFSCVERCVLLHLDEGSVLSFLFFPSSSSSGSADSSVSWRGAAINDCPNKITLIYRSLLCLTGMDENKKNKRRETRSTEGPTRKGSPERERCKHYKKRDKSRVVWYLLSSFSWFKRPEERRMIAVSTTHPVSLSLFPCKTLIRRLERCVLQHNSSSLWIHSFSISLSSFSFHSHPRSHFRFPRSHCYFFFLSVSCPFFQSTTENKRKKQSDIKRNDKKGTAVCS